MNQGSGAKVSKTFYKVLSTFQVRQFTCTLSGGCSQSNKRNPVSQTNIIPNRARCIHTGRLFSMTSFNTEKEIMARTFSVFYNQRRNAGHSHWQNIMHTKAAGDKKKSEEASRAATRIRIAIVDGGSADPKKNSLLAKEIATAKSKNVPNETIQRVIRAISSNIQNSAEVLVEANGIGGMKIIVQCFSSNPLSARQEVRNKTKRFGVEMGGGGSSLSCFDRVGFVEVELQDDDSRNHDDHVELALDVEAEEVSVEKVDGEKDILKFQCSHQDVQKVKKSLEDKGKTVIHAASTFIPKDTVTMPSENLEILEKMVNKLKELDSVEEVYTNIVIQD